MDIYPALRRGKRGCLLPRDPLRSGAVSLSILTLNLWNDSEPFAARMGCIRDWLETTRPDLIGFQEVVRGEALDQLEILVGGLGYATAFGPVVTFWKRDDLLFGNGVASRWPISEVQKVLLPRGDSTEQRGVLCARIASPWGQLSFSTTHLDNRSAENRTLQAQDLVRHLANESRRHDHPPLLVGDLNAEFDAPELATLRANTGDVCVDLGLTNAEIATWSQANPNTRGVGPEQERLDHILVAKGEFRTGLGAALRAQVVLDRAEAGVWPSDHFGLLAEVTTPDD